MVRRLRNARSREKELFEEMNSPTIENPTTSTENESELLRIKRKRITSPSVAKVKLEEGEVNLSATAQAHRVQFDLGTEFPSFIKVICKSDVEGKRLIMRLPFSFCRLYLPKDGIITLEDENEEKIEVKYLSQWMKFATGWKNYIVAHNLRERDVLVFHLVEPTRFKVYLIRDAGQVNVNSTPVEQNAQESFDLLNPLQELGTFEDSESKRAKLPLAGKVKLERNESSPAMVQENHIHMSKSPSFIKRNCNGRSMSFPKAFGTHLPKEETMFTVEDENNNQFEVKFCPKWLGFGGGWRDFAVANNLHKLDVLHFHLVNPLKLKVYIERVDHQVTFNRRQQTEQVSGGSKSSDNLMDQSIELGTYTEFLVKIRSLCLESELDDDELKKYYKLCCSKKDILHDKTLNSMNSMLLAVIISKTIKIADEIKASDVFTPKEKLEQWENSLKSFKLLGMKVEFLLDRVSQLVKLRAKYEGTEFTAEMKNLEAKREKLKESYEKVGVEIEKLKSKTNNMHKVEFQQVLGSPW